ncbi:MAG: hypothetical protein M1830_006159 [Pleopsidium flavum]|nr:MAG: hypothetical protein M1830_006159 [Pleopsidium flavum]
MLVVALSGLSPPALTETHSQFTGRLQPRTSGLPIQTFRKQAEKVNTAVDELKEVYPRSAGRHAPDSAFAPLPNPMPRKLDFYISEIKQFTPKARYFLYEWSIYLSEASLNCPILDLLNTYVDRRCQVGLDMI